jgi:hypothetical protein
MSIRDNNPSSRKSSKPFNILNYLYYFSNRANRDGGVLLSDFLKVGRSIAAPLRRDAVRAQTQVA